MGKIRVLVTGEHTLMHEGLLSLLKAYEDIEVIGEATNGKRSLEETSKLQPDVVVMDMNMKLMNGFEATRQLLRDVPKTKVIILVDTTENVTGAFVAGARGCIPKATTGADLASAIRMLHKGEVYLHPSLTETLIQDYLSLRKIKAPEDPYEQLSRREKQVLRLVAEGRTSREIAEELGIAVKTALGHRANVMSKLGIHHRTDLTKYAIRRGLITLDP